MRSIITKIFGIGALLGLTTHAQISQQCVSSDVCYRLNIPAKTAQNNKGDVFFSISGPTTYSWIALGQGSSMSNANVFLIYTDGKGNVTLSPRHASGEFMPVFDPTIDAELLAGSGVQNGVMTANIRCKNCQSWQLNGQMDFSASSGNFIFARKSGSSIDSTSQLQLIQQHSTHGTLNWPFTSAVGGQDIANPFINGALRLNSTAASISSSGVNRAAARTAHGVLACLAFVMFFPIGAILIRVGKFPGLLWIHAGIQFFAFVLYVTAFGIGLWYGITGNYMSRTHPIIGIVVFGLLIPQPLLGWLHHLGFVRKGTRTLPSYGHIWIGRSAIILGMINGGLGLKLTSSSSTYKTVYGVFAGIMGVLYLAAIVFGELARKKAHHAPRDQEKLSNESPESPVSPELPAAQHVARGPQELPAANR